MNLLFLISGVLAIFLAAAHAAWGEKLIIPELRKANLSNLAKIGFYVSWHQITMVLLVSGLALAFLSFWGGFTGADTTAILIVCITIGNFLVFLVLSFIHQKELFGKSIPQIILFVTLIALILIGIIL